VTAVLVAGAGACGVLARYGLTSAFGAGRALWTVLVVNVVGSFLLGLLAGAGASSEVRVVLGVGFLGGFTTFSTFSLDVFRDLEEGPRAAVYVVLSVGIGVAAAGAGWVLARG
jgi:CrcB protein